MKQYTGKQVFLVEHEPTCGEIKVEIDFDKVNEMMEKPVPLLESIKAMVLFWTGGESLIDDFEGDYVKAFLKNLCQKSLAIQAEYYVNTRGVISRFEKEEGYILMDGSMGIKLINVSEMELSNYYDYTIKAVI